ncbi:hypothetical protein COLO4_25362 [Corchorus olitorius]|uniref:Uncharacterized protein n=1 Tax=Corchorus olitorius TaxID=93759 RepID=A0A1R3I3E6_9ROSI|nr:hypothetical protein COLO4_25362 [Corchorus olitorius]
MTDLVLAFDRLNRLAASSFTQAASFAVFNVLSQCLHPPMPRISADHLPSVLFHTPL